MFEPVIGLMRRRSARRLSRLHAASSRKILKGALGACRGDHHDCHWSGANRHRSRLPLSSRLFRSAPTWRACLRASAPALVPRSRAGRARLLQARRASIRRASRAGSPMRSRCSPSASSALSRSMRCCGCRVYLPLNPQGFGGVPRRSRLQHGDQLRHQHQLAVLWRRDDDEPSRQMVGLTVQNFLSAATGIAMAFALVRGFARAESPTLGNFWVDLTRVDALRAAAALDRRRARPRRARRAADARTARSKRRRSKAPSRRSPSARSRARRRSSSSAPMAAASSTSIPRILSRTRTRWSNYARDLGACSSIPFALGLRLRPHGRRLPPGLGARSSPW